MLELPFIQKEKLEGVIPLPASKSISHRYLILQALAAKGNIELVNLSKSNDTQLLQRALNSTSNKIDFEDAGTPMRFYLAYAALQNLKVIIDGNNGLRARPIQPLIDALSQLGCRIKYLESVGHLPIEIEKGVDLDCQKVTIDPVLSSQFLSALLLIAPKFNKGLCIQLNGIITSKTYVDLTCHAMSTCGIEVTQENHQFYIPNGNYHSKQPIFVESDWSAAAFVMAWAAARKSHFILPDLQLNSKQGDLIAQSFFEQLGLQIKEEPKQNGISVISNTLHLPQHLAFDFIHTPDMFPVIAATCAFLKIEANFKGVKNLVIKESNRIVAMQSNLQQVGAQLEVVNDNELFLRCVVPSTSQYAFKSYNDHRIAMACSIFAFEKNITIDNANVVNKSFPNYWELFKLTAYD